MRFGKQFLVLSLGLKRRIGTDLFLGIWLGLLGPHPGLPSEEMDGLLRGWMVPLHLELGKKCSKGGLTIRAR